MQIKTRILLLFVSVVAVIAATLIGIYIAEHRIDQALLAGKRAYALVNQVSELNSLGTEINIADFSRVQNQWELKVAAVNVAINNYDFDYEHDVASTMRSELRQLDSLFDKMVHIHKEERKPNFSGNYVEARYYLWNHFSVLLRSLTDQANHTATQGYRQVRDMQFKRNSYLLFIATLWIIALLTWAATLWKGLMAPLKGVLKAIHSVGEGNLKSRVPVNGKNSEMNGLIISFNSMMDRLQDLTVSRKHLIDTAEQERARIGRELHDGICQAMAAARLQIETIQCMDEKSINTQQRVSNLLQQTLNDTKRIVKDMRPLMLDDIGLIATLEWLKEQNEAAISIVLHFDVDEQSIPAKLRTPIFRICQEALNNAVSHGLASKLYVQITANENAIDLSIEDNGQGFKPSETQAGNGIINIRERVAAERGEVTLETAPGKGCCILITFPLSIPNTDHV